MLSEPKVVYGPHSVCMLLLAFYIPAPSSEQIPQDGRIGEFIVDVVPV